MTRLPLAVGVGNIHAVFITVRGCSPGGTQSLEITTEATKVKNETSTNVSLIRNVRSLFYAIFCSLASSYIAIMKPNG